MTAICTRQQFNRWRHVRDMTAEETIASAIDALIAHLYEPHEDLGWRASNRTRPFRDEPINWGDLGCVEVKALKDETFVAIVEEAAPAECPEFCAYIAGWLKAWGWDVEVRTEW